MYFSEIYIDNFKTLRKIRINLDRELNVFTGTNNAGKTTILEALALWSECFRTLMVKAKKSDPSNNIRQGDYRLGTKSGSYIDHRSITSVRTSKYEDIFYEMVIANQIVIEVKVIIQNIELSIPIRIKSANGGNYLICLDNHDNFDFATFNSNLNLPTPFTAIYASPVAALVSDEKYVTPPQVNQQILSRKSFLVLRNRISKLKPNMNYQRFENDVSYVLFESTQDVKFEVIGDINKDVKVNINVYFGSQTTAKDISLLGSGTLQIIELMLAIYEDRSDLNLIMLDEPDSHIHRDIQKRLIEVLTRNSIKAQVFITTHNESLIRATKPQNIFHINDAGNGLTELVFKPIAHNNPVSLKVGIQPSGKSKVIKALGNSDSLDILDCLEAKKIVFVEGEDDALFIRKIYEKVSKKSLDGCVFWSLNGLDTFIECINHYKSFFKIIASHHNLWEKSIAVIDADYMTEAQRQLLCDQLHSKINLPTFIWGEYTIESSIMSDRSSFSELIHKVLLNNGASKTKEEIKQKLSDILDTKCTELITALNEDSTLQMKITGQIVNRNKKWNECVGIHNLFNGNENSYLINYQKSSRPLLQSGHCTHMLGKDGLQEIFQLITQYCGIEIQHAPLSLFEYLIDNYDNSIQIEHWNKMVEFLDRD